MITTGQVLKFQTTVTVVLRISLKEAQEVSMSQMINDCRIKHHFGIVDKVLYHGIETVQSMQDHSGIT
jgi:hypothetical protein